MQTRNKIEKRIKNYHFIARFPRFRSLSRFMSILSGFLVSWDFNSLLTFTSDDAIAINLLIVATLIGFKIPNRLSLPLPRRATNTPQPENYLGANVLLQPPIVRRHLTKSISMSDELMFPFVFLFLHQLHQIYLNYTNTLPPSDNVEARWSIFLTYTSTV